MFLFITLFFFDKPVAERVKEFFEIMDLLLQVRPLSVSLTIWRWEFSSTTMVVERMSLPSLMAWSVDRNGSCCTSWKPREW